MKQMKSKKKWTVAASTLAAIAIMAGTFAWFTSEDSAKNHFEGTIAGNDIEVVETFTPPTEWPPGSEVNKDVAILNTGEYDAMVRVSFEEMLNKLIDASAKLSADSSILDSKTAEQIYLAPLNEATLATGTWTDAVITPAKSMTVTGGDYAGTYTLKAKEQKVTTAAGETYRYVSYWDNGTDKYYAKVGGYSRNETTNELTPATAEFKYVDLASAPIDKDWTNPVYKPTFTVEANGNATIDANADANIKLHFVNMASTPTAGKWFYNDTDGYFYYIGKVAPQEQTPQLLDFVELSKDAGNEYSKVKYDLIVNSKGIQASKEAVNSTDWVNNTNSSLVSALEGLY